MREYSGMKWARCSTLTESTWRTPVRCRVRLKVRIVGVAWAGSRNPWAASAMRRACARLSLSVTAALNHEAVTVSIHRRLLVVECGRRSCIETVGTRPPRQLGQIQQFLAHGVHDRLHARVQLELLQDVADVVLHGVL